MGHRGLDLRRGSFAVPTRTRCGLSIIARIQQQVYSTARLSVVRENLQYVT